MGTHDTYSIIFLNLHHSFEEERPQPVTAATIIGRQRNTYQVLLLHHAGEMKVDYYTAKSYCLSLGMRLPLPENMEKNSILAALTSIMGDFWLAAHRSPSDFNRWEDEMLGSPIEYSNWARNEPNNYKGRGENKAKLRCDGAWNDVQPKTELAVVCSRQIDVTSKREIVSINYSPETWREMVNDKKCRGISPHMITAHFSTRSLLPYDPYEAPSCFNRTMQISHGRVLESPITANCIYYPRPRTYSVELHLGTRTSVYKG